MKPSLAAMTLGFLLCSASYAQMSTPTPAGPPSTQALPKSASQPASGESVKDTGGPQITVPLKRPRPPLPAAAASAASLPSAGKTTR